MSIEDDHPETKAGNRRRACATCDGTGVDEYTEWGRFDTRWQVPPTLEYPCEACGAYYEAAGDVFTCWFCGDTQPFPYRDECLQYLSDDAYMGQGKPGVLMGTCPLCDADRSVNGGPDGELHCDECGEFYAGQYSTEWWLYAAWASRYDTGIPVEVRR